MKFGVTPLAQAVGGIVVHSIRQDGFVLKKGETVTPAHVGALKAIGIEAVTVAKLDDGDIGEDDAARRLADSAAGANVRVQAPFTGRSNLFATCAGVLMIDVDALDRINDVDESVTIASLPPWRAVVAGEMIGTIKIIPFAVEQAVLESAIQKSFPAPICVKAFQPMRVGVVSTLLPGLKASVVGKTLRVLEERLAPAGARIAKELRVPHEAEALAPAIAELAPDCDIVIVFGASAITDRRDVIPAALERAGGQIVQFGMPVDPGNLMLLGRLMVEDRRVHLIGAPGCARSPKENGFDWVLQRLLANIEVTSRDIRHMGAGGLLMEIVDRGQLRAGGEGHEDG